MRATLRLLAVVPAMGLALAAGAQAQTTQPETARRSQAAPQAPSAANPNPDTPTPRAPDMQTYLGMLQRAEQDLQQQISRSEGTSQATQRGATPPEAIQLIQAARTAWQTAERAPQPFAGGQAHGAAMQDMRHRLADVTHVGRAHSVEDAVAAARGVLESLRSLRQAAASQPS